MRTYVRTSERRTWKECRQQWWWSYVEQLEPRIPAPALRFGTLVHKAMELRYPPGRKRGPHPARTFEGLYEEELTTAATYGFRDEEGTWHEAGELGVALLEAFVDHYGTDDHYEVLAAEQTLQVRMRDADGHRFWYAATLDGVWRDLRDPPGVLLLKEWKTASRDWSRHLAMDEQASSYWAYAPTWLVKQGLVRRQDRLRGILYTFLYKRKPDTRPQNEDGYYLNKDGSVSKNQPPPLFERHLALRDEHERRQLHARVQAEVAEMRRARRGALAIYKNPTSRTCGSCGFRDMCELHEIGADWQELRDLTMVRWEPYQAHALDPHDHYPQLEVA